MRQQIPIKQGLFTWPSEKPELLGSRCISCAEVAFPAQFDCRNCGVRETESIQLGDRGTLWTWTIQTFMPKDPYHSNESETTFTPYGVGYVELASGVRVESRLMQNSRETLHIGMPMQLNIVPYYSDDQGNEVMIFCFNAVANGN